MRNSVLWIEFSKEAKTFTSTHCHQPCFGLWQNFLVPCMITPDVEELLAKVGDKSSAAISSIVRCCKVMHRNKDPRLRNANIKAYSNLLYWTLISFFLQKVLSWQIVRILWAAFLELKERWKRFSASPLYTFFVITVAWGNSWVLQNFIPCVDIYWTMLPHERA